MFQYIMNCGTMFLIHNDSWYHDLVHSKSWFHVWIHDNWFLIYFFICLSKMLHISTHINSIKFLSQRSALAYRNDSCDGGLARINVGISTTSTTSRSTSKSSGGLYKGEDYLRSTSTSTSGNMPPVKYPHTGSLPPPYAYDPEKPDGIGNVLLFLLVFFGMEC